MSFTYTRIITDVDGTIVFSDDLSDLVKNNGLSILQTVGDEQWIKSGELNISSYKLTLSGVPLSHATKQFWLAVKYKGIIQDVYKYPDNWSIEEVWESYDAKTGIYEYTLKPLQAVVYNNLKETILQYSTTSSEFNYDLPDSIKTLTELFQSSEGQGDIYLEDLAVFVLPTMLKGLEGKHNDFSYIIDSVDTSIMPEEGTDTDNFPLIFRGESLEDTESDEDIIDFTFYEDGSNIFHMNWIDIFSLAVFGFNSYIKVTPVLDTHLECNISLVPRSTTSATAIEGIKLIEQKHLIGKRKIAGVKISGENFIYTQGNIDGDNIFEKTVEIADSTVPSGQYDRTLYWIAGDWNSGTSKFDYVDPYFASGLVEAHYADMLTNGSIIEGKIRADYDNGSKVIQVLDYIEVTETLSMLIDSVEIDAEGYADIEGLII